MAEGIHLTLKGDVAEESLQRIIRAAENPEDALDAIGGYLVTATQRRFERETDPAGAKWQRLSPRTANRRIGRVRRGYAHILRVKLRLYSSIVYQVSPGQVAVGSNLIYARIQQLGGTINVAEREQEIFQNYDAKTDHFDPRFRSRRHSNFARRVKIGAHTITIPARAYLGIDDDDRTEIAAKVEEFFREQGGLE
jgi:phage gpG-like protein